MNGLEWIVLEICVALGLAAFIVWWTMGGSRKPPPSPPAIENTEPPKDRRPE